MLLLLVRLSFEAIRIGQGVVVAKHFLAILRELGANN